MIIYAVLLFFLMYQINERRFKERDLDAILQSKHLASLSDNVVGEIYSCIVLGIEGRDSPNYLYRVGEKYRREYISFNVIRDAERRFQEKCRLGFGEAIAWIAGETEKRGEPLPESEISVRYNPLIIDPADGGYKQDTIEGLVHQLVKKERTLAVGRALKWGAKAFVNRNQEIPHGTIPYKEYEEILKFLKEMV